MVTFALPGGELTFDGRTHLMAVVNRSPESEQGDVYAADAQAALRLADEHRQAGATIIDLGGQSTNLKSATELPVQVEIDRIAPTLEALVNDGHLVSIDTWKPDVARAAIELGASIINDTSGLADPAMVALCADSEVGVVVMYLGADSPLEAGEYPTDLDVVTRSLADRATRVAPNPRVIVDPGVGITHRGDYEAYTRTQFRIAQSIGELRDSGFPVLYPIPRKADRAQMFALIGLASAAGADILRVHDTAEAATILRGLDRL